MSETGQAMLRRLLGEERAAEVRAAWAELSPDFAQLVTNFLAGEIWSRPNLDLKTRGKSGHRNQAASLQIQARPRPDFFLAGGICSRPNLDLNTRSLTPVAAL